MRVECVKNEIAALDGASVRERIRRSVHIDGPLTDLVIGRQYAVQALEQRDGGLWIYVHTVSANDYPFPYPAEMFKYFDSSLAPNWSIRLEQHQGTVVWRRLTFPEWASDDRFYERLVEGDPETVALYKLKRSVVSADSLVPGRLER